MTFTIEDILGLLQSVQTKSRTVNKNLTPPEQFWTKKVAAEFLGVTLRTVERYIEQGKLTRCVRGRNRVCVLRSEVEALVKGWRS